MPQRYDISFDGNITAAVEFCDSWTYAELREVDSLNDAELMGFIAGKMTMVDIPADGGMIASAADFANRWQDIDNRFFNWLLSVSIQERTRIGAVGETMLRESLASYVRAQATTEILAESAK